MACAPEDVACKLEAIDNAADAVVAVVQRIHGAMDVVEQAAQSFTEYLAAEEAVPVVILKIHVTLVVLAIVFGVVTRAQSIAWQSVMGSTTTALILFLTVWSIPAADLHLHVIVLLCSMGLLSFVEKNGR